MRDSHILESTPVDDGISSLKNVIFLFPFFSCIQHFQYTVNVLCFSVEHALDIFLYLFTTITKISWCWPCFALWECIWEWLLHGGMSQWGPLKDRNCESIISRLCSIKPLGRVGSGHLIQSFSSTMMHYTLRQHKRHPFCWRRWK